MAIKDYFKREIWIDNKDKRLKWRQVENGVWECFNKQDEYLGWLAYEKIGRYKQWCWYQKEGIRMSPGCLEEVREMQKEQWINQR